MLKRQIEQDLKTALLAGDTTKVSVLRSIKTAITYAEVDRGIKGKADLDDDAILEVLGKESKKRLESSTIFAKNGYVERANQEAQEQAIIDEYLPPVMSAEDLTTLIDQTITALGVADVRSMGIVMSEVKKKAQSRIDSAVAAQLIKERLQQES